MNKIKVFSIFTACLLALTIGLTSCASSPASGGGSGSGGTLTITDIPSEFNGGDIVFYVIVDINSPSSVVLEGLQNWDERERSAATVSNGRASMRMWMSETPDSFSRYNGNDVFTQSDSTTIRAHVERRLRAEEIERKVLFNELIISELIITFPSVRFSNGSATLSCNDGIIESR